MRKNLVLIILLFTTMLFYGCNKNTKDESPVSLYAVDINALNNKKILDIVSDKSLQEGVYQIITTNNNYLLFIGLTNKYTNINSKIENHTLIISCNTSPSSENSKKLYVIREKNSSSQKYKNNLYDTISLKINNKDVPFNSIFTFEDL